MVPSPVHAHDQLPGSPDGQTETDPGEGELRNWRRPGKAFRIIHLARACVLDNASVRRLTLPLIGSVPRFPNTQALRIFTDITVPLGHARGLL
jgi:hypothetical protein